MKINSCLGLFVCCQALAFLPLPADPDFDLIEQQKQDAAIAGRLAAERDQDRAKALEESNWLLQSYQEHLKGNNSSDSGHSDNIYATIAANPDLARLAGIPFVPAPDPAVVKSLQTGASPNKDGLALRGDPDESDATKADRAKGQGFQPLITPLTATTVAGLHDFFSTSSPGTVPLTPLATSAQSNSGNVVNQNPPVVDEDPAAVETPGMTAAESHMAQPSLSLNLSQEALPDDPPPVATPPQDTTALPLLPSADVAGQLHKVTLSLSGQTPPADQASTPIPQPIKLDPAEQPAPPPAPPNIGRARIPDPMDMLER